jgi:hypothetical protein
MALSFCLTTEYARGVQGDDLNCHGMHKGIATSEAQHVEEADSNSL